MVGLTCTSQEEELITARTFRARLRRGYQKYRNILILANGVSGKERVLVDGTDEALETAPAARLRAQSRDFQQEFQRAIDYYGVTATAGEVEEILWSARDGSVMGRNSFLCISKYHLLKIFKHYERALAIFPRLPVHARVGIDISNIRQSTSEMEVFQLEASLFEDMADLLNEALRSEEIAHRPGSTKVQTKHAAACMRGAAKAAFNLLEGYLNGLAGDIILLKTISPADRVKLAEWDDTRQKAVFLSLRDKLLQYPKIAAGREHPVLQESSCPAMERVLKLEKELRHALIHPRPQVIVTALEYFREAAYFGLTLESVAVLCDDVIQLIYSISAEIGLEFGDVSLWLARREPDGLFPESVFQ